MKKYFFMFIIPFLHEVKGQNLIPNGSFEYVKNKSSQPIISREDFNSRVYFWSSPTKGNPDLVLLHKNNATFPDDFKLPKPVDGESMLGLFLSGYTEYCEDYREYVQIKLKDSLLVSSKYQLEFWLTAKESDEYDIGCFLSTNYLINRDDNCKLIEEAHLVFTDSLFKRKWKKITFEFQPKFSITHIILGNFSKYKDEDYKYCYFDKFRLIKLDSTYNSRQELTYLSDSYNSPNILFERGKYEILEKSYDDLNKLYDFLLQNPNLNVIIEGHTDSSGYEYINNVLSLNRATEIKLFLTKKGLESDRITCIGYGSSRPRSKGGLAEHMRFNRRVTFKFITR